MTAAARKPAARPSPREVFVARAEARAMLWQAGEISLHDAVDELWAAAVRDGLVAKLGPDKVQQLLADAFAPVRDDLPRGDVMSESKDDEYDGLPSTFAKLCRNADEKQARKPPDPELEKLRRLLDDDVSIERAWSELNKPTNDAAASTLEALMFSLRERGTAALAEPETRRRLAALSTTQVQVILARLMALRPKYPAIDDELLFLLGEQLR
jgi:hypothetical protein